MNTKKAIIILILFSLAMHAISQGIRIESFELDKESKDAGLYDIRDANNNSCALVKVNTSINDLLFQGDFYGISNVIDTIAGYWVYVPEGAKSLRLKHSTYGVMRYIYPLKIESLKVYNMQISGIYESECKEAESE